MVVPPLASSETALNGLLDDAGRRVRCRWGGYRLGVTPEWSANIHHVVGGALLAGLLTVILRDRIRGWWLLVACAVGLTMIAEAINELAEWRLIRGADAEASAYYDLVADLGTTPLGALLGAAMALWLMQWRRRSPSTRTPVSRMRRSDGEVIAEEYFATSDGGFATSWIPASLGLDLVLHRTEDRVIWLSNFRVTPDRLHFDLHARYDPDTPIPSRVHSKQLPIRTDEISTVEATSSVEEMDGVWRSEPATAPVDDNVTSPAASVENMDEFWPASSQAGADLASRPSEALCLTVAFDGMVASYCDQRSHTSDGMALSSSSSMSGGGQQHASLHCSAVPTSDVTFTVEWPLLGIIRIEFVVGGDVFREGASRALPAFRF